ncbi:frataxin homolog, mitochondrial [Toxorhynchites rutilus septentrionalis]|uniref:frataxin homolog, mitochondrial n=1 Tax=Toxorhynchites rutilus septentrionalis TaxID=329112 RepID=UPI00247A92CE|nr:frataxin homolog, mitochondrial [Toxorhynchites rutilus septentrionalis]
MSLFAVFRNIPNRFAYRRYARQLSILSTKRSFVYKTLVNYDQCVNVPIQRNFSSMNPNDFLATSLIDSATFEAVCSDTLESLCEYFEQLVEETSSLTAADVTYGDGVLTINFGHPHGTYVINRQSPNRQIWLSSPTSGPKRYDFIPYESESDKGFWIYKHDGISLHELLQREIKVIVRKEVDFLSLPHSKRK